MFQNISNADVEKFWEDGYLLIKNVFSKEEILNIREKAYKVYEEAEKNNLAVKSPHGPSKIILGDLLSKPLLKEVLLDDRILNISRKLLGNNLVYFGDSSMQVGSGARGFHKDNANRTDPNDIDWKGKYSIIRFGIYLQDHKNYSGGLKVKKGSHNYLSINKGKTVLLDTEIGDVAVWSLRTSHSGNVVRMKFLPWLPLHVGLENRLPAWLRMDEEKERVAFFFSYGIKDEKTDKFMEFMRKQSYSVNSLKNSKLDERTLDELRKKNIELIKVIPEYGL